MKKYIGFIVLTGLILSFSSVVKAEDNDETSNETRKVFNDSLKSEREDFKGDLKLRRETFKENIETERKAFNSALKTEREKFKIEVKTKKEEFKLTNSERKATFCEAARNMVGQRFEVATRNLERFQTRVEGVIAKLNADGKETSLATESLNLSKENLAEAKVKIAAVRALIPATCESITPETFAQIKLLAREAKDLLKESKENLHQAILAIKDLREEDGEEESDEDNQS